MRPAFPTSDYYGPSVPARRHQPTAGLPAAALSRQQRGRRRDGSHVHHVSIDGIGAQLFPCSIATSTPQTFLVASPPTALRRLRSPRPRRSRTACAAIRPTSTRLEPASALRGFNHWFTLVTPSVSLSERWTVWWCRPASPSSGLLPPSPALPGSGCPQLPPGCCDSPTPEPFHLRSNSWRLVAHNAVVTRTSPSSQGRCPSNSQQPARPGGGASIAFCATSEELLKPRKPCSRRHRRARFTHKSSGDPTHRSATRAGWDYGGLVPVLLPADRGDALAASGGSANAIAFPSGSGTFTWRTPFE